jgi:AcrR family transcriptional regulator
LDQRADLEEASLRKELKSGERPPPLSRPRKRLSRKELMPGARSAIFAAAATVVARHGYSDATVKRITTEAGMAQGTFYLYFKSRQELFDELLPHVGAEMLQFIRDRVKGAIDVYEVEERGFRAFFEYWQLNPGFIRVLNEASGASPTAFRRNFKMVGDHYHRSLLRGLAAGQIRGFDEEELEVVAYLLIAARDYLHLRYVRHEGDVQAISEKVVKTYMKVVRNALRSPKDFDK